MTSSSAAGVKYIFVTGGVTSSLGKGVATAAIGALLQARELKTRLRKLDPYLNIDPGTMSPFQHGEVFITDDGCETDLDLGYYERFTNQSSHGSDSITAGRIYADLLERERRGDFLGATVQVIPHVTDAIKNFITNDLQDEDVVICEIGGTAGDIESLPFLEAIRQMRHELGWRETFFIHATLVPWLAAAGELKTKPTQHSVKELLKAGIQTDMLLCRTEHALDELMKNKISLFCNVRPDAVIEAKDTDTIYQVPLDFHAQKLDTQICQHFGWKTGKADVGKWRDLTHRIRSPQRDVAVAVVGKYTELTDSYKSLVEALLHGGLAHDTAVEIKWLDSDIFLKEDSLQDIMENVSGILVPGGFGKRGSEGKMAAARLARTRAIPYLGICLGMQMAVVEAVRAKTDLQGVGSTEFDDGCAHPIVGLMEEWQKDGSTVTRDGIKDGMGGTMRLGSYECVLAKKSLCHGIYGTARIWERHRHRYEVNIGYEDVMRQAGMTIAGRSPDGNLPEIVELENHPWFVGVQFHPEIKSRPLTPHPLFADFIRATVEYGHLI